MRVTDEEAAKWSAIRTDSFACVEGAGVLTMADTDTGEVHWRDRTGEEKRVTLGGHAIRLLSKKY